MSTYVPGYMIQGLINVIQEEMFIDYTGASAVATQIVAMINYAVSDGVSEANHYTDNVKADILSRLDDSLNTISDWVRNEIDNIIDTFGPALTTALEMLADAQLLGQESTVEYLDDSFNQIAETHGIVGDQIETVIATTADHIVSNQDLVKETLEEQSKSIFDNLTEVINKIVDIPAKLIGEAITSLVPAQASAWLNNLFHLIESGPMTGLVRYLADKFGDMLSGLMSFTDDEVKDYLTKFTSMWTDHAKGLLG